MRKNAGLGKAMPVLPIEAYTSEHWFRREQESIFSRTWRYAGLAEDLSEPGQYRSIQAGLNNIFVVMGRDRRLRAFHNICRHRGTQLLRAEGKTQKAITCPYHDWTYDLEGQLVSVPEREREFPKLDLQCMGLHRASVDLWRGMMWVHPEPDPPSLAQWFGPAEHFLGPHRPEELVEYTEGATQHIVRANWKIVVENYIDAYHLSHLHSGTLSMYDHARIESRFVGPHFVFYEPLAAHYAQNLEANAPMPLIDHIPQEKIGAYVPMLFPGLGLTESESSWSIFHVTPLAADRTRVETRTKVMNLSSWEFTKQAWRSASFWNRHYGPKYEGCPKYEGDASTDPMASGDFMAEDIFACEQQQKSLQSPYFSVGASAAQGELPVRQFQRIVQGYVESRD